MVAAGADGREPVAHLAAMEVPELLAEDVRDFSLTHIKQDY